MNSYFQLNFGGTEAPLFVIDHTWVPPPTKAQFMQEEQQLYMDCLYSNLAFRHFYSCEAIGRL
jgi:hypothetical protein